MYVLKELNVVLINKDLLIINAFAIKDLQIIVEHALGVLKVPFGVLQPVNVFMFVDKIQHTLQLAKLASVIQALDFWIMYVKLVLKIISFLMDTVLLAQSILFIAELITNANVQ